jgi:DUF4097 and DUF4098 domain-containing protein YvlB
MIATLLATNAFAEDVTRTLDAASDGTVEVSNIAGSIEIRGWSRKEVEVEADLGDDVEELVFERDGDRVLIKVEVPRRGSRNISSDLVIHVPAKSSVRVGTVSAEIVVEDVTGALSLKSVSGDVTVEAFAADVEIETVSGDVDVRGDDAKINVRVNTVSGDIDVQQVAGEILAGTVSGDIQVVNGEFDRVRMSTTNGDMYFKAELNRNGRLSADTINGEVDINLKGKVAAKFEIETFNGGIRNCFGPKAVRTSKYAPGKELNFSTDDANGWVTIKTLNGDVSLCDK